MKRPIQEHPQWQLCLAEGCVWAVEVKFRKPLSATQKQAAEQQRSMDMRLSAQKHVLVFAISPVLALRN